MTAILVIRENPKTLILECLATTTSWTVLIPTVSTPSWKEFYYSFWQQLFKPNIRIQILIGSPLFISYFSARETSLPLAHLFNVCLHSSTSTLCADWRKSDRGIGGGIQIPEAKLQAFLFLFPSRRPKSAPESLLSGQETFNANHSWDLLGSCLGLNRINQIKYCK